MSTFADELPIIKEKYKDILEKHYKDFSSITDSRLTRDIFNGYFDFVEQVDQYRENSDCFEVIKVNDKYFENVGYYLSHDGYNFDTYIPKDIYEVEEQEVTEIKWCAK